MAKRLELPYVKRVFTREALPLSATFGAWYQPQTEAVRRALRTARDDASVRDLLFLEAWAMQATVDIASTLRAGQIRRANPQLVAELRAELSTGRRPDPELRPH